MVAHIRQKRILRQPRLGRVLQTNSSQATPLRLPVATLLEEEYLEVTM